MDRETFDDYSRSLNVLVGQARNELSAVIDLIKDVDEPGLVRDILYDALVNISDKYGDMSSLVASDLCESVYKIDTGNDCDGVMADNFSHEAIWKDVRFYAKDLFSGNKEKFFKNSLLLVDRVVKQHARDSVIATVESLNKKGIDGRYARVPQGETCVFCLMLSSRGFVYHSKETAGELRRFHPDCDCQIFPSWSKDPRLKGYDPDGLYQRYLSCRKTIDNSLSSDFLRDNELGEYKSFDEYATKRILKEMSTRDRRWLNDGTPPDVDYTHVPIQKFGSFARADCKDMYAPDNIVYRGNEWRDLFAHYALSKNGLKVAIRPESIDENGRQIEGVTSPDIWINGCMWEIKSPQNSASTTKSGNDLRFVERQLRSARNNFNNPYNHETMKGMGDLKDESRLVLNLKYKECDEDFVCREIERQMRQHSIKEIIVILKDESIRRYK